MSLLYECINGLISGGLLAAMGDTTEGEELASVCVTKLRGFLVEGDSNRTSPSPYNMHTLLMEPLEGQ